MLLNLSANAVLKGTAAGFCSYGPNVTFSISSTAPIPSSTPARFSRHPLSPNLQAKPAVSWRRYSRGPTYRKAGTPPRVSASQLSYGAMRAFGCAPCVHARPTVRSLSWVPRTSWRLSAHSGSTRSKNGALTFPSFNENAGITHCLAIYSVERALQQDSNNSPILQFLQALEERAAGEDDSATFAFVEEWVPGWRLKVVRTLKKPGVGDAKMIVSAILRAGDAKMLENT